MYKWIIPSDLIQCSWNDPWYIFRAHRLQFPNITVFLSEDNFIAH